MSDSDARRGRVVPTDESVYSSAPGYRISGMNHAVIMAGGAGTRLWPLSRASRPKQLVRLLGDSSLIRQSYERLAAMLPAERIYVITGEAHLPLVAAELPELPSENLIGEPMGRDTANAVALAAAILYERDPDGVMGVFTADHVIRPVERFVEAVQSAFTLATGRTDALLTIGVKPRSPETAFGYVKRGKSVGDGAYEVDRFTEKPDAQTARGYVESGAFYWNSGNFVWSIRAIMSELRRHLPDSHAGVTRIATAWGTPEGERLADAIYPTLEKISIDYAVMEKADHVLVVPMDCDWCDVGTWMQLGGVLGGDADGNVSAAKRTIHHDSRNVIAVCEDDGHLIATLGMDDVIVVRSPDATLICRRDQSHALKDLVNRIKDTYGDEYL